MTAVMMVVASRVCAWPDAMNAKSGEFVASSYLTKSCTNIMAQVPCNNISKGTGAYEELGLPTPRKINKGHLIGRAGRPDNLHPSWCHKFFLALFCMCKAIL